MTQATLVCANHPDRTTLLRCNRCNKPICSRCAVLTPVGYRCRECVQGVRAGFDNVLARDYPLAALVSAAGVGLGAYLLGFLAWWGIFAAPVVGGGLAEAVGWAVGRRRGTRLPWAAAAGGAAGALAVAALPWISLLPLVNAGMGAGSLAGLAVGGIWPLVHGTLMVSTMYYRLRGIQL